MKFQVTIVGHGAEALEFLNDSDNSFFILFNENAPEELAEISVLHTISAVYKEPAPGDTLKIGDKEFKITAVGVEAPYTLRELGHCLCAATLVHFRYLRNNCQEYCGVPGRKWKIQEQKRTFKSSETRTKSI